MDRYGLDRVAYVDIDAHHGDGVFYGFETEPKALFADIHEDGRFPLPRKPAPAARTGRGPAEGTKLNIPMPPGSGDDAFLEAWNEVEAYIENAEPQLLLLVGGADSLAGDPITHLQYSEKRPWPRRRAFAGVCGPPLRRPHPRHGRRRLQSRQPGTGVDAHSGRLRRSRIGRGKLL